MIHETPKSVSFTIPGEAVPKKRPKFSTANGKKFAYTPAETKSYEMLTRMAYEAQCHGVYFTKDKALELEVLISTVPVKSVSGRKRADMISGTIKPAKRPDIDNLLKSISDGLNKVAFYDDAQIVKINAKKIYAEHALVFVAIREIGQAG